MNGECGGSAQRDRLEGGAPHQEKCKPMMTKTTISLALAAALLGTACESKEASKAPEKADKQAPAEAADKSADKPGTVAAKGEASKPAASAAKGKKHGAAGSCGAGSCG
jgi:hypothetical protein